jgi:DNA-directed RNA polymerase specialized sigma24 family protein
MTMAPGFEEAREIRQSQKRLTSAEKALVAQKYKAGATTSELGMEFGCHRTTIHSNLKATGVAMRRAKTTTEQVDEAVRLYRSGLSMVKVGGELG